MFFDDWEQLSKPTIRPATPSDTRTIARIHVDGWRTTYQDVLPAEVLKSVSYADRERTWMRLIAGGDSGPYVLVAEHRGEGIVGFIAAGPERSDDNSYSTEVYAIYVDEPHQRTGIGRSLLQYVAQIMGENGQEGLLLWTFAGSPTNTFFEHLGARVVTTRRRTFGETPIEEVAYGWPNHRRLFQEGSDDDPANEEQEPEQEEQAGPEPDTQSKESGEAESDPT